eukprot:6187250-Pleurochrysis_carterae.AAC.2
MPSIDHQAAFREHATQLSSHPLPISFPIAAFAALPRRRHQPRFCALVKMRWSQLYPVHHLGRILMCSLLVSAAARKRLHPVL